MKNTRVLAKSGVRDWIIQRGTAVFLLVYMLIFAVLLVKAPSLDFLTWKAIFTPVWFKVLTIMAFLSICLHTWVGLWTVLTDYVKQAVVRFLLLAIIMLLLVAYFIWFIEIIQGVV